MRRPALCLAIACAALLSLPAAVSVTAVAHAAQISRDSVDWQVAPVRLLMVEAKGCIYCAAWNREIGPGYPKSAEGKAAPLLVTDIDGPWPDGVVLDRRPTITPTFILLQNGDEVARLEGYPGDQFFYPLIDDMLSKAGLQAADTREDG